MPIGEGNNDKVDHVDGLHLFSQMLSPLQLFPDISAYSQICN